MINTGPLGPKLCGTPSGGLLGEISVEVTVFMLSCAWLCLV